jgi:hypothetical protein
MKGMMISGFTAVALLAIVATMLWSHSSPAGRTAGLASLQGVQNAIDVNKLPVEEIDDQSLVFSKKRQ